MGRSYLDLFDEDAAEVGPRRIKCASVEERIVEKNKYIEKSETLRGILIECGKRLDRRKTLEALIGELTVRLYMTTEERDQLIEESEAKGEK